MKNELPFFVHYFSHLLAEPNNIDPLWCWQEDLSAKKKKINTKQYESFPMLQLVDPHGDPMN